MKIIKTFETFDYGKTLSGNRQELYYHCDDCDQNIEENTATLTNCTNCNSTNIEELSKEEFESLKEMESQKMQESLKYGKFFQRK